jgi:hypothetical protein
MRREVLAALALFVTSASAAPGQGLAVVEVNAPAMMQGLAQQITRQVFDAARAQGMKVVSSDELETFLGPKNLLLLKQCAGSASCVAGILADLPVNRAVVGTLGRDDTHYLVHLWLVALKPPAAVAEVDRAILIASRRLTSDVAGAIPALLRGEQEAKGTLVVEATVPGASVTIDGEPVGESPVARSLKPGKHQIRVVSPGFYPVERLAGVEPGRTTRDVVRLVAIPGTTAAALGVLPPTPAAEPTAPGGGGGFRVPVAGWVALGVGVAAAGAGTWLAVASHDNQTQLQAGYDPARNSYQGFRSQAVTGQNQATWANVCFGVAGAGLVTWGILTWIASSAPPSGPHAAVGVGPQGVSVAVSGTF